MKTLKLLPFLFSVLFFVSCSEDDEVPTPNANTCQAVKFTTTAEGNTEEANLTYDAQGRVTKAVLSGGDQPGEMNIQYNNNLPSTVTMSHTGTTLSTSTLTYDAQKRLVKKETQMELFGFEGETTYEYNAQNRVSKAVDYAFFTLEPGEEPMGGFSHYATFAYDAKGNITKKSIYEGETEATATLSYTVDYTYDNAPNPATAMEFIFDGYSTPNNILTAVYKENGAVNQSLSYATVYQYNASGLPTQSTETTQAGEVTVYNITYVCK